MVCSNCGTQVPDGTPMCPTCGAQLQAAAPDMGYANPNDALFNQQPYEAAPVAPAKSKTGMIVGIVAAVVAIALIVFFVVKLAGGSKYNGTYDFYSFSYMGMTLSAEEMEAAAGEELDINLVVKNGKCTLNANSLGYSDSGSAKIKFDGEEVTFIDGDEEMYGTYDADEEIITLEIDGMEMAFKKAD